MPRSGGSTTGAASNTQGQAKFKSSRVGSTEQEPGKGAGEPTAASPEHSIATGRMITSQVATSPNRSGEAREEAGAHSYRFYDIAEHGIDAETLGEIEVGLHDASVFYLSSLEKSIEDREWIALLARDLTIEDHQVSQPLGSYHVMNVLEKGETRGVEQEAEAARARRRQRRFAAVLEKFKQRAKKKSVALQSDRERWKPPPIGKGGTPVIPGWDDEDNVETGNGAAEGARTRWFADDNGTSRSFVGRGYGLTISEYAEQRREAAAVARVMSGGERRQLMRDLRKGEGESVYLGFEAFGALGQKEVDSVVISEDKFSAIDTGTTLTIATLQNKSLLSQFNPKNTVKIVGFNGSVTSSKGSGQIIGFATSRGGRRVSIRIPNVHVVPGAPNELLSVSGMVALGYEFHFTPKGAWVVTPELEVIDVVTKGGLYWLRWAIATDPLAPLRKVAQAAQGVEEPASAGGLDQNDEIDAELASMGLSDDHPVGDKGVDATKCGTQFVGMTCGVCDTAVGVPRGATVSLELLHRRMGHFSHDTLEQMVNHKTLADVALSDRKRTGACPTCLENKATRKSVPKQREGEVLENTPFSRVWTDLKGKVVPDLWGNCYLVTFTCEVTRWTCVYVCKQKSEVVNRFKEFLRWVESQGWKVRKLNSDGGGEYTAGENASVLSEFNRVCSENQILQNFTSANTPAQNGISERLNRTLVEHATCVLNEAGVTKRLWSLAVKHIVWVRNRVWHRSLQDERGVTISPFERLYGRPPRVSMARVWGCDAWILDHDHTSGSFKPKARKGIFIGISANRKGWVIFDPATRKARTSYHVSFDESMENRKCALRQFDLRQHQAGPGATTAAERAAQLERELYVADADQLLEEQELLSRRGGEVPIVDLLSGQSGESPASPQVEAESGGEPPRPVRAEVIGSVELPLPVQDESGGDGSRGHRLAADLDIGSSPDGAESEDEHASGPNGPGSGGSTRGHTPVSAVVPPRRAAIGVKQDLNDDDYAFLEFAYTHDLPINVQQLNPKKKESRVRYEKYKAARTLRELKRLGGSWDDVKWDFARGFYDFNGHLSAHTSVEELEKVKLREQEVADLPTAYVDYANMATVTGAFGATSLEESIQQDFAAIGLDHIESLSHRTQRLLQRALGNQTLAGFAHCCASRIMFPEPVSVQEALASEHAAEWKAAMQEEIDTLVRFNCYERVAKSDALEHGRLVKSKQVIRNLYGTKEYGIVFSRSAQCSPHAYVHTLKSSTAVANTVGDVQTIFGTYADADLAGDETTQRSTSGYCIVMHGGLVSWMSKLQSTVALSTAEAETNAGVEAVKQVMHMRLFLRELGFEQVGPSKIYEDNNAAISLAHGKEQSKRARHYALKVHFLNEQYELGTFMYEKVGTKDQLSDAFTKALPRDLFQKFREWMGVQPL